MAFKSRVKSLEELSDAERPHYKLGDDDHFHLEVVDDGKTTTYTARARAAAGLMTDLAGLKTSRDEWKTVLGERTPQQVKSLLDSAGDIDARIAAAVKEVREKEVAPLQTEVGSMRSELTVERRDRIVGEALDKAGVKGERKKVALTAALQHVQLAKDGKTVQVIGEDGQPSVYDVPTWIGTTFKQQHDYFFDGTAAGGSGSHEEKTPTPKPAAPAAKPGEKAPDAAKPAVDLNDPKSFLANIKSVAQNKFTPATTDQQ